MDLTLRGGREEILREHAGLMNELVLEQAVRLKAFEAQTTD